MPDLTPNLLPGSYGFGFKSDLLDQQRSLNIESFVGSGALANGALCQPTQQIWAPYYNNPRGAVVE